MGDHHGSACRAVAGICVDSGTRRAEVRNVAKIESLHWTPPFPPFCKCVCSKSINERVRRCAPIYTLGMMCVFTEPTRPWYALTYNLRK
jgi:hypothetical protein